MLYAALLVTSEGFIYLLTNRDVVPDPHAGPLVGPMMNLAPILLLFVSFLVIALRVPEEKQRIWLGTSLLLGVGAYALFAFVGAIMIGIGTGDFFQFLAFLGPQLIGPFAAAAGVFAVIVAVLFMLVLASRVGAKGRPLWPWERVKDR